MKYFAQLIGSVLSVASWIAGVVIANGFWSTTIAVFFPPWAWYLLVEKCLIVAGWVSGG